MYGGDIGQQIPIFSYLGRLAKRSRSGKILIGPPTTSSIVFFPGGRKRSSGQTEPELTTATKRSSWEEPAVDKGRLLCRAQHHSSEGIHKKANTILISKTSKRSIFVSVGARAQKNHTRSIERSDPLSESWTKLFIPQVKSGLLLAVSGGHNHSKRADGLYSQEEDLWFEQPAKTPLQLQGHRNPKNKVSSFPRKKLTREVLYVLQFGELPSCSSLFLCYSYEYCFGH